jgi:hypothetical protein
MNRLLHYAWPLLTFVAAALAPNLATRLTLITIAFLYLLVLLLRGKKLEHNLLHVYRRLLMLAALAELLILIAVILTGLDVTIARNYALLVLAALTPLGLEAELIVLLRVRHNQSSESARTALSYASEDAYSLLAILGLSFIATLLFHIPPALSVLQLLFITCVARPLISGRLLQATPHITDQLWRIIFTTIIVYGSFVFFFIRHYLEPSYADSVNPITWQATTVALLVFIACQVALPVFNPRAPSLVRYRAIALLGTVLIAAYLPVTRHYFMTKGPDAADWCWVIIAGLCYTALCLLQRQVANHYT